MENEIISNQELLVSNMLETQALIRILEKKEDDCIFENEW